MINLLAPPIFDDEDKTLVAHHLFIIVWTFMAVGWLAILIAIIIPETVYRWLLVVSVIESAGLILLALNKYGHTRLVSNLLIFIIWAVATGMALTGGGTSSNAMALYFIIVFIAGLVLSGKAGIITAVFCSLTGLFLVYLEYSGALPVNRVPHTPFTQWISNTIYMAIIISLQYLVSRTIRKTLKQSRQELKERQRAELALRESEELFKSYLEYAPDGVYMSDLEGNFLYGNRKCEEIIGYRREELIGKNFLEFNLLSENSQNKAVRLLQANIDGKSTGPDEIELISKEGRLIPVEINTSVVQRMGQGIILAFVRDITERKRMEEALRESNEKLQMALNGAEMGMWDLDLTTMSGTIDERAAQILGYQKDEIPSQIHAWDEMTHPDDVSRIKESIKAHLEGRMPVFKTDHRMRTATGEWKWVHGRGKITKRHIEGSPIRISGTIHDITEHKLVEEALTESEERYRALVENASDLVFRLDDTGHLTFVNPAALRITGYEEKEIIGRHYPTLIRPDMREEAMKFFGRQFVKGIHNTYSEYPIIAKDGHELWLGQNTQLIVENGHVIGFQAVSRDITDRKRIAEALRESENRYRELSIVDDLTQLYNSRHFYFQLKIELDRSNRYGQPLTLLLLDLDDFKVFNDAYGHVEGDQVLWRLGQVVKRCLRETDFAYRYGGEEFTIILPMTKSADGAITAERIIAELKEETFSPAPGQDVHVTVSIGLAQYKPQEEMKAFVHRVDQLMYQGKKNGKDGVCCES